MSQMVLWMLGIAFAAAAMLFTAALEAQLVAFALAAVIVTGIVLSAVRDYNASFELPPLARSAILVRHMGMLWCWAAMSLSLVYGFLLRWSASHSAFLAVVLGAGLCLFVANISARDARAEVGDARISRLVGALFKAHFAIACVAVGGLLVFGKLQPDAFGGDTKWAAVNILLCLGLGLAVLTGFALAQPATVESQDGATANEPAPVLEAQAAATAAPDIEAADAPAPTPAIPLSRLRRAARTA